MKRVVLDTSVIASFLTDRNAAQQEKAAALLEAAQDRRVDLVVPQLVVAELAYVLQNLYRVSREETARTIRDLLALPGVRTVDALSWPRLLELWPGTLPDFADAALVVVGEQERADAVASFDARFRRAVKRSKLASYW